MMRTAGSIERRRAARATLSRPIAAWLAGLPVTLVDLSIAGARVEHDSALGIRRELKLRFEVDGMTLVLSCVVLRCRLQRSAARPGAAAYSSGLRFVATDEPSRVVLRSLIVGAVGGQLPDSVDGSLPVTGV